MQEKIVDINKLTIPQLKRLIIKLMDYLDLELVQSVQKKKPDLKVVVRKP